MRCDPSAPALPPRPHMHARTDDDPGRQRVADRCPWPPPPASTIDGGVPSCSPPLRSSFARSLALRRACFSTHACRSTATRRVSWANPPDRRDDGDDGHRWLGHHRLQRVPPHDAAQDEPEGLAPGDSQGALPPAPPRRSHPHHRGTSVARLLTDAARRTTLPCARHSGYSTTRATRCARRNGAGQAPWGAVGRGSLWGAGRCGAWGGTVEVPHGGHRQCCCRRLTTLWGLCRMARGVADLVQERQGHGARARPHWHGRRGAHGAEPAPSSTHAHARTHAPTHPAPCASARGRRSPTEWLCPVLRR